MKSNRLALALFAATMLFSMVREFSAPIACARSVLIPSYQVVRVASNAR